MLYRLLQISSCHFCRPNSGHIWLSYALRYVTCEKNVQFLCIPWQLSRHWRNNYVNWNFKELRILAKKIITYKFCTRLITFAVSPMHTLAYSKTQDCCQYNRYLCSRTCNGYNINYGFLYTNKRKSGVNISVLYVLVKIVNQSEQQDKSYFMKWKRSNLICSGKI